MKQVHTLILTGYGLNCEEETAAAFHKAGSRVTILHINELAKQKHLFDQIQILAIPGGFSYGDHIGGGRVYAYKLKQYFQAELTNFIQRGQAVLGICNGFQILIHAGILPGLNHGAQQPVSLIANTSAHYENRWVTLKANAHNPSFWLRELDSPISIPVRHGVGRFIGKTKALEMLLKRQNLIALQYASADGTPTQQYPENPNGSHLAIAGMTNPQGNVLGLMPHPEACYYKELVPHALRHTNPHNSTPPHSLLQTHDGIGMVFFYNAVRYARECLL